MTVKKVLTRMAVPDSEPGNPAGEDDEVIDRIAGLLAYWRDGYDWRAQERRLNAVPQFRATVDGVGLHFLHAPGSGPDPMPLLLCNDWPSSMVEYLGALSLLSDPAAHGDDPADSFTVVVPALPGYGFSIGAWTGGRIGGGSLTCSTCSWSSSWDTSAMSRMATISAAG